MTPNEIEMNARKELLNKIIIDAENNNAIDYQKTLDMFVEFNAVLEIYKYSGDNSRFQAKLTDNYQNNTDGFKDFLNTVINDDGVNVYQYLMSKII